VDVSVADGGLQLVSTSTSALSQKEVTYPPVTYKPIGEREFMAFGGEHDGGKFYIIPPTKGRPQRLHTGRLMDKVG
jgi:hypothetical protein